MELPVIPSRDARLALGGVLARFRNGDTTPVVFGSHRKPEAVIVAYAEWVEMRRAWEAEQEELHLADLTRTALDDSRPSHAVDGPDALRAFLTEHVGGTAVAIFDEIEQSTQLPAAAGQ